MTASAKSILIADDEPTIRRLLAHTLSQAGYTPVLAGDGSEAIARGDDGLLCALVDLKMPGADGMQVLEHFQGRLPDVPVVIMSAQGEIRDAVAAMKAGAFDYVLKPFDLDEVLAVMRSAAQLGGALKENRVLRSLLPICASCKDVRNDKGYWESVEQYFGEHGDIRFSHGICDKCVQTLYPEEIYSRRNASSLRPREGAPQDADAGPLP